MVDIACFSIIYPVDNGDMPAIEGELLDSETGAWAKIPAMNVNRSRHPSAVAIQQAGGHRIYMVGGGGEAECILNSCEFIDVGEDQWTLLEAKMTTARSRACAILLDHTTIVICGGFEQIDEISSCESLDLTTHTFSPFPSMMEPRGNHAGVHYRGTIVVLGGHHEQKTCEQFDPAVFKWTPFAPLEWGLLTRAAVVEDTIYAVDVRNCFVQVYDGTAWVIIGGLPLSYRWHGPVVALGGKVVVVAEHDPDAVVLDPANNSWSRLTVMSRPRIQLTAVSF